MSWQSTCTECLTCMYMYIHAYCETSTEYFICLSFCLALSLDKLLALDLHIDHFWTLKECKQHCVENNIVVVGIEIMDVSKFLCSL